VEDTEQDLGSAIDEDTNTNTPPQDLQQTITNTPAASTTLKAKKVIPIFDVKTVCDPKIFFFLLF
jgi:hypothetical protein